MADRWISLTMQHRHTDFIADYILPRPVHSGSVLPGRTAARPNGRFVFGVWLFVWLATTGLAEDQTERNLDLPITFGVQTTTYPYAYNDEDGRLTGFAIDIANAVTRAAALQVRWKILANDDLGEALHTGQIDAISFWSETKERHALFEFSVPIIRLETAVVVRQGDKSIRTPGDLNGRRVALGQKGTVSDFYLREQLPGALRVYAKSTEEYLRMVVDGSCDAAIISQLTAVSTIDRLGLKRELRVMQGARGYDVRFCMVVKKGDALLLARFNEGLAVIHRTGEFGDIYEKWFGRYEKRAFTPLQIVSYVAAALALVVIGALWGLLRQRILTRRIVRQAEELAEQRSLLAALYDKHPLATVVLDVPETGPAVLVSLNPEAARFFALDPLGAAGRVLTELALTTELRAYLEEALARWRTAKQAVQWEQRLPAARLLLEASIVPLGLHEGKHRLCILSADITKRRLLDEEIAMSRRLRALGELVGGIAHEFNNLLTPIIATTSLLQAENNPATPAAELGIIEQAAKRAAELTRRLLTFGRKFDEHEQSVQIAEVVANCQALLKTTIDRRIEWEIDLPPDLPPLSFNPTDLNQVIINLVLNARDTLMEKLALATDPAWKPRLTITATELPATAHARRDNATGRTLTAWQQLTVADNGRGIPPEIVDRIFEPFYTTKEVGKGTGLGLSTLWHVVTDAGGDITVESRPGEGTAFHVFLPCWQSRLPAAVLPPASRSPLRAVTKDRILVIDDEPLVAKTVGSLLRRHGYEVEVRSDSVEAWELLKDSGADYHLLLLDLSMPRLGGLDLIRRLREKAFAGKIVVMSGRVTSDDEAALRGLKIDAIISKPFVSEQLLKAVTKALHTKPA